MAVPLQRIPDLGFWNRRLLMSRCAGKGCKAPRHVLCEEQTLSLNRNEKAAVVTDVSAQAARSQTLALAEYRGLTVEHLNKLRVDARAKGVYLHVLKNTLARRAVAGTPFEVAQGAMVGPLIYGFSEDAVAAAKVISDFAKTNDKLVIKGGAYAGKALDAEGVKALAAIPSREVLISQVAGLLKSPMQRMAAVVAALAATAWWWCCRSAGRSARCSLMT
jgi:large subunit ribosomal protein L10